MADAKLPFDLKDVRNFPTALVALFALVWLVIGGWFALADSAVERSVAGVLFATMFLAALGALFFRPTERDVPAAAATGGLDPKTVREGASSERINAPHEDELPAPDGSYLIMRPPPDWEIDEREFADLLRDENRAQFGTDQNPFQVPALMARAGKAQVFRAPNAVTVAASGARTLMHGRQGFSWIGAELRSEIYVVPFEREQPPYFVDFPFPHMALQRLIGALATGFVLQRLEFGKLDRDGAPVMVAEATVTLDNVLVNGRPATSLRRTSRMVATRGVVRDYVIAFVDYAYEADGRGYAGELETMQAILASFRPLKVANVDAKRAERRQHADAAFAEFMTAHGREFFYAQLQIALQRIAAQGLNGLPAIKHAVDTLRAFREGADAFPGSPGFEERTAKLWEAFDAAANGEPALLRAWMPQGFAPNPPPVAGVPPPAAALPAPGP